MDALKSLFLAFVLIGCGQHQASSEFFEKSGQEVIVEEDQSPIQKMKRALFDGDLESVQSLIQSGEVLISDQLPNGRNFLEESVFLIRFSLIRYFLQVGINPGSSRIDNVNLIEWASVQPEKEILLRALLKTEADDQSELMSLIEKGSYQEILQLINQSIEINFIDSATLETPLTYSILNKKNNAIRVLFSQKQLDVNLKNQMGESPLKLARRLKLINIEKELIKRNAQE